MISALFGCIVSVHPGLVIRHANHQVKIPVQVKVCMRNPGGHSLPLESPGSSDILEAKPVCIPVHIVIEWMSGHLLDVIHHALCRATGRLHGHLLIKGILDEVHVSIVADIPIGDEHILAAIIVKIRQ